MNLPKNLFSTIFILFVIASMYSCGKNDATTNDIISDREWSIPTNEIFDGGPGKDGIPSVDKPEFTNISQTDYLDEDDLVVGIVINGEAKAYPHVILDWHEIVNDELAGSKFAVTYCPLTGTATAWNRVIDNTETTFGVSGLLYNSNLIPYDRETDSYWSQIALKGISGDLINDQISTIPVIETSWNTWKKMYPQSQIMTTNTGFSRDYGDYPYGDYRTNNSRLIFPVSPTDNRLPSKERVLGILSEEGQKAYSINDFEEAKIITDSIGSKEYLIIGSKSDNYIVAFENNEIFEWEFYPDNLPLIAIDQVGRTLSIDGIVSTGEALEKTESLIGYWFSFGAFYPDIEL